ncbi:hypothetical protein [Delftia tsuruhatensis]|uniref:hypothetical protein n=1 Tax=Delftia tsuruhatensis TaxID=180282 RepID=UPI002260E4E8|nr:hypothetical protein [Delftia tsuruhatensis]MCX7505926.1 hypothetical protein [Delftia tsuruhatensis]
MSRSKIEEAFHLAGTIYTAGLLARAMVAIQGVKDAAKLPEHEGEGITIPAAAWQAFTDEHASVLEQIQLQGVQAHGLAH